MRTVIADAEFDQGDQDGHGQDIVRHGHLSEFALSWHSGYLPTDAHLVKVLARPGPNHGRFNSSHIDKVAIDAGVGKSASFG